jgi:integrase
MVKRRRRQWGKGSVDLAENGTWKIRWREGGRRRTRGGFATRDDAERVLAKALGDLAQGRTGLAPDPRSTPRLDDLAADFLERRKLTHRTGAEDGYRWRKHLAPHFGRLRPGEIDAGRIRAFIETKLAEGANPATIRIYVAILSALFTDLVERHVAQVNPTRNLPRSTMRLMRPTHDPRTTPFIERLADVRRIYLALEEPLSVAYAIGALAGLRTGEVFALRWEHVDLAARRIHVRESVKGALKDKDSRVVPILDALAPILTAWKLETGGEGRVIPPLRRDGGKVDKHTPGEHLRPVLEELGLARRGLGWYEATRHTFASQWVMAGASIEKLKEILGHYSVVVTERYAHLRPDLFPASDLGLIEVDLHSGGGPSAANWAQNGIRGAKQAAQDPDTTNEMPEPPCKPSPVPRSPARSRARPPTAANIPLGRALPRASSELYPEASAGPAVTRLAAGIASLFALAPGGVCRAAPVTRRAVRSYRTVSPLPRAPWRPRRDASPSEPPRRRSAVCSLWHFPPGRPDRPLTGTLPSGARTFLGGPDPASRRVRPSGSGDIEITSRVGGAQRQSTLGSARDDATAPRGSGQARPPP